MKHNIILAAIAAAVFSVVSCIKVPIASVNPSNYKDAFEEFVEPTVPMSVMTATDGYYTLEVSGQLVAHSHNDALPFSAVLIENETGTRTSITNKCVWDLQTYGNARVENATYTSVYKDALKSRRSDVPEGLIPEASTTGICKFIDDAKGIDIAVTFPITFQQTIHIGFNIEKRRTANEGQGKWEFMGVATYPVPYTTNVIANLGYAGSKNWQIDNGKTCLEYLTDPNYPVNSETEADQSKIIYVVFNDRNQSTRYYNKEEQTCYFLHTSIFN